MNQHTNLAAGAGGLTGATGDLTPDSSDVAFVPGERREIEDPEHAAAVTIAQGRAAPAQAGEIGGPAEPLESGPTNLAQRGDGYGSQHGLNPNDPAYQMETHFARAADAKQESDTSAPPRIGGDEVLEAEPRF